jgi:hypothetical protein
MVHTNTERWVKLGNTETDMLREKLAKTPVEQPIYVTGLARAGTTILLEALAAHPQTASHSYRSYPMIFTPYFWERIQRILSRKTQPIERSHRDGIMVTPESPEAMEEMLWMAFFEHLHEENHSAVLGADTENLEFQNFYREHIKKLLLAHKASRYLSKANYNITRIPYLLSLFPDARFVVMARDPAAHVASLIKQDALFCETQEEDETALEHTTFSGHFEFGLNRRLIHVGDDAAMQRIRELFYTGEEARGWAAYWAMIYGYINALDTPAILRVRYEDLCEQTAATLTRIAEHCALDGMESVITSYADIITPKEQQHGFDDETIQAIREETAHVALQFGYEV